MRAFFCGLASLAALSVQAAELHVGAGKEHLIGEPVLHLQRLVLEDGATLRMAPGLGRLQLQAEQAWIGKGVRILARGEDAAAGAPGTAAMAVTGCVDGRDGGAGGAGMSGGQGVDLQLLLGLQSFGSLLLDSRGGAGGSGGDGGAGSDGSSDDRCAGGHGGAGGAGGDGGTGGRGGEVVLRYWSLSAEGFIPISNYGPGVQVLNGGGAGAAAGQGGAPGEGGRGELVKRPTGIKVFRNPGSSGKPGQPGRFGAPGEDGRFLIEPLAKPAS